MSTFPKQPVDVIDYDIDFGTKFFTALGGDSITSAAVSVARVDGVAIDPLTDLILGPGVLPEHVIQPGNQIIKIYVGQGKSGVRYRVSVTATCASGRVWQHDFFVQVRER